MLRFTRLVTLAITILTLLAVAACSQGPAPAPTSAPAKPTAAGATATKPAATASPAAKPAAATPAATKPAATASAKPAANSDWKAEWDNTVAAAKKEGRVVVAGPRGQTYRDALMQFRKAYPDIQLEYTAVEGGDFAPKLIAERDGGQFLWDVHIGGSNTALTTLKPKEIIDPLPPALILPEVIDESKWVGGFSDNWLDKEGKFVFAFEGKVLYTVFVNRDFVSEAGLNTIDQLVDPKWKGKMSIGDPRMSGTPSGATMRLMLAKGEDWLRSLFRQDLTILKDERQLADNLVRGVYPITIGINPSLLEEYKQQGVGTNIKPLDPDSSVSSSLSSGRGNAMFINKAPHPNAARVFINWLLTQEGQKAYTDYTTFNSRRLDVEGPPEYAPKPGIQYPDGAKESYTPSRTRAIEIAKEELK